MLAPVIEVRGLVKRYGDREAIRGVDLEVAAGEVFAFLGPNGAGKTTTVEILEGYRSRSGGDVRVLGLDPGSPTRAWRQRVGIVLQSSRVQPELTVAETVALYAAYYTNARSVGETIDVVATGEPGAIGRRDQVGGEIRFRRPPPAPDLPPGLVGTVRIEGGVVHVHSTAMVSDLHVITGWALEQGLDLVDLTVRRRSLEDVYLELTAEAPV